MNHHKSVVELDVVTELYNKKIFIIFNLFPFFNIFIYEFGSEFSQSFSNSYVNTFKGNQIIK